MAVLCFKFKNISVTKSVGDLLKSLPKQVLKFLGPSLSSERRLTTLNVIQSHNWEIGISFSRANFFEIVDFNAFKLKKRTSLVPAVNCKSYMFCSAPTLRLSLVKGPKKEPLYLTVMSMALSCGVFMSKYWHSRFLSVCFERRTWACEHISLKNMDAYYGVFLKNFRNSYFLTKFLLQKRND